MNSPSNPVVQEVPEEAVEALAAHLYDMQRSYSQPTWDAPEPRSGRSYLTEKRRGIWRGRARKYLAAAYPAIRKEIESKVRAEERERLEAELLGADWQEVNAAAETKCPSRDHRPFGCAKCVVEAALAALSDTQEAQGG